GGDASFTMDAGLFKPGTVYKLEGQDASDEKYQNIVFRTTDSADVAVYWPASEPDPRPVESDDSDFAISPDGSAITIATHMTGQITVQQVITEASFMTGNPAFSYEVDRIVDGEVTDARYGAIEFTPAKAGCAPDGSFSGVAKKLSYVFTDLPVGDYVVKEIDTPFYKVSGVVNDKGQSTGEVSVFSDNCNRTVTFTSKKTHTNFLGSSTTLISSMAISAEAFPAAPDGPVIRAVEFRWNGENPASTDNQTLQTTEYVIDGGYARMPDVVSMPEGVRLPVPEWSAGGGPYDALNTPVTGDMTGEGGVWLSGSGLEKHTVVLNYYDGFAWQPIISADYAFGQAVDLPPGFNTPDGAISADAWFADQNLVNSAGVSVSQSGGPRLTVAGSSPEIDLYAGERAQVLFSYPSAYPGVRESGRAAYVGGVVDLPALVGGWRWYDQKTGGAPLADQSGYRVSSADATLFARND
ncbi:MAG: hypothetical protein FWF44_11730, partial [Defluviitaleaceae bacterium]|nr:hypothetical protein [Defluviitaleaceae bacterium]